MLTEVMVRNGEIFSGLGSVYDSGNSNSEILNKIVRPCILPGNQSFYETQDKISKGKSTHQSIKSQAERYYK